MIGVPPFGVGAAQLTLKVPLPGVTWPLAGEPGATFTVTLGDGADGGPEPPTLEATTVAV